MGRTDNRSDFSVCNGHFHADFAAESLSGSAIGSVPVSLALLRRFVAGLCLSVV